MPSVINCTTTNGIAVTGDNSGALALQTNNGTTAVTIDTSQNVGIGTTSPAGAAGRNLTIYNSSGQSRLALKNSVTGDAAGDGFQIGIDGDGEALLDQRENLTMRFSTNATERMRIDTSGNLLVAKTTTADSTVGAVMQNTGRIAGTMAASTNATDTMTVFSTGANLYRFYLGMGGTIYATSTTITGISDQRLKENIVDLDDGLDAVLALKPRKFDWKEGKGKDIKGDRGFIAQEFETVFPDMIEEWKDPAPEGEEPYKGVNANLIPTLVKAIQELNAKVEAQAVRIAELEGAK